MTSSREIAIPWLASRLGCTISHAQALVRRGRIPGHKTASGWVTTEEAIDSYLTTHPPEGHAPRGLRVPPDSGID